MSLEANWVTIERPGQFGKKRDDFFRQYTEKYGADNWRIAWEWNRKIINFDLSCIIYEDGYYYDSFRRRYLWEELGLIAKDVRDYDESDVESGLDYKIQKGSATHLQDIAIRRVFFRIGLKFKGNEVIQIRSHKTYWGEKLSPGKVLFHLPKLIVEPHLKSWWEYNSIEDFYQSNKILQVKE